MQFDSDFMNYRVPRSLNIDYKVITPQTNNKLCKYVCHVRTFSDMGHLAVSFEWDNGIKPTNSKEYEKNNQKFVIEYFEEFVIGYTSESGAYLFKGKYPNRQRNIMRFYLNGDIFVRADYN